MLSSIFSKNDIVALFPVKYSSSEDLKEMTLSIIKVLTDIGYTRVKWGKCVSGEVRHCNVKLNNRSP